MRMLGDVVDTHPLEYTTAVLAAAERPEVRVEHVMGDLDTLGAKVHIPEGADLYEQVARVNHALFVEHGFTGDTEAYDAPENSFLDRVLARRKGLPILLSIVAIAVARRAGLLLHPISFPSHFLVAPAQAKPRFFVDPFHQGQILSEAQLRARLAKLHGREDAAAFEAVATPSTNRQVMVRVCTNLALSYLQRSNFDGARRVLNQLSSLEPEDERVVRALQRYLGER